MRLPCTRLLALSAALLILACSPQPTPASSPGREDTVAEVSPPAQAAPEGFAGVWETTYGRMRLNVDGDQVDGCYATTGGSRIEGRIDGKRLEFRYTEERTSGGGWFELSPDGRSLKGEWQPTGAERQRGWEAKRVDPVPGRIWLVVLEAHWEDDLSEPEYAFGDMLRSYFQMFSARHVEVRQRYFHDEQDFRRFAEEVAYLAEPAVLSISTHGTPQGIEVGGRTIGPEVIAQSLKHAENLELLHLSGCSMMQGTVPRRILTHFEPEDRFPISGYSTFVAWDASALADFHFLSFLLIHRLAPDEALRQTHLVAPYTGSEPLPGAAFEALGLDLLSPDEL